jgi:hypothetical protein
MSEMKLNQDYNKFINIGYTNKEDTVYSRPSKSICASNNLKDFISNINKFNFTSAFDHKGAKSFLRSKGKALKEINIEDYSISEEEETSDNENTKTKHEKRENEPRIKGVHKHHHRQASINPRRHIYIINDEHRHLSSKNKKKIDSIKSKNEKFLSLVNKKFITKKKSAIFCSQIELRMFKDKTINKLKPIKNSKCTNKRLKYYSCNNLIDSSFDRKPSSKSNSTLIQIVNEISQSNIQM